MFVDFKSLDPSSKVWIYSSNQSLNKKQCAEMSSELKNFVQNWKRHGEDLRASFKIEYDCFIVLAVDERFNEISGCSIDASVNLIKKFEEQYGIDLTNKMNVPFKNGDDINIVPYSTFQQFVSAGKILPETVVFNNMITNKRDFDTSWEVPASQSWHNRFFNLSKAK